ncbi:MAG: hypothetical protein M3441_27225 [Chloroflexota bacterium]|jgi:hypothetical protein|nr:hypothetical protein [Chloroflexota bacterium]
MANLKPPRGPASSRELADFVRWVSFPSFPFTVASATDTFTATGHTFANGQQVRVASLPEGGVALPAPLSAEAAYFVRDVSGSSFKLAATQGGPAIDIAASGSGSIYRVG